MANHFVLFKYVGTYLLLVHIRKLRPVRCVKSGFFVFLQSDVIALIVIDKRCAFKIYIRKSRRIFLNGDTSVSAQLIQQIVTLISQGHCSFLSASFYFLNLQVQFIDTVSDLVYTVNIIFNLLLILDLLSRTKSLYDDMKSYQSNINEQIKDDVDRVNKIGNRIYELNLQIQKVEAGGQETAMTLRDERDNLLDELGGYGSVSIKEDATGFTYVDFESTPFIDDNKCYNIGLQEDKETGFYTPYWTQLSDVDKQQYVRVFKKNEVISTDLNTDVGSIKAKLLARGDGYGTYQDLESEEAYDRISGCTMMETEAQVSALLHNIVTKINDAYCPNKTVDTDVTYTDADGNQASLKGNSCHGKLSRI